MADSGHLGFLEFPKNAELNGSDLLNMLLASFLSHPVKNFMDAIFLGVDVYLVHW